MLKSVQKFKLGVYHFVDDLRNLTKMNPPRIAISFAGLA